MVGVENGEDRERAVFLFRILAATKMGPNLLSFFATITNVFVAANVVQSLRLELLLPPLDLDVIEIVH